MHGAVLAAALLQAATGIGFGVIAGPIILMAMGSGAAVQVTCLLSLLIALLLAPSLVKQVDRVLLGRLLLGSLAGLPIGILVFVSVGVDLLKLLAGAAVLFMATAASGRFGARNRGADTAGGRLRDIGTGVISGVMSASLAMPGPVAAARMAALAHAKEAIRATILMLFVFSYSAAIALQAALADISRETWWLAVTLVPATLAGILLGRLSLAWISESLFRRLIVVVLLATAAGLLLSSIGGFFDHA